MDLRSIKLRVVDRHVRARVADHRGERGLDFEGEASRRVLAAAAGLLAALERRAGAPVRALSVDFVARVMRASLGGDAGGSLRIAGAEFAELTPLCLPTARAILEEQRRRAGGPPPGATEPPAMSVEFWRDAYRSGTDRWELARPAPPLARWFATHPPRPSLRALVPGCGRGHEARMLARAGARVLGVDFAPEGIRDARRLAEEEGLAIDLLEADLFSLPARAGFPGAFELIVEHTCFCAIDPARRDEYVAVVAGLLAPGGDLVGLFYAHGRPGGPPFAVDSAELHARFCDGSAGAPFELLHEERPADSVASRLGEELLMHLRRRA